MTTVTTVLAIEDEAPIRRLLRVALPVHGFSVLEATTGRDGIACAGANNPGIILLDLGLPDGDGINIARRIREFSPTPIIVVSARGVIEDKVAVLDAGADDYLTKPFAMEELVARLRVARRRAEERIGNEHESAFVFGPLRVDLVKRAVHLNEREIHLTPTEYRLLAALVRNRGRVMTHQQLLKAGWGVRYGTQTQYLHVYMGQLRAKLQLDPSQPKLILTETGVGYRMSDVIPGHAHSTSFDLY
jgi:two-component system KDP operon response regulator KdpE